MRSTLSVGHNVRAEPPLDLGQFLVIGVLESLEGGHEIAEGLGEVGAGLRT